MALPDVSKINPADLVTPHVEHDPDPQGYADSVRQVLEALPAVREALQLNEDRLGRIRFDGEWGEDDEGNPVSKVIIPIGRRDDDAVRELLRYIRENTTDLEFDGVLFILER
ncbi:MAG: hypothetical protein ACAI38_08295 [Myxococcota bacterium]|nr:hypothetical protein [Myxococcota bacterium]